MVTCGLYCLVVRGYLRKFGDPWAWADQRLEDLYREWPNKHEGTAFLADLDILRDFPKTDTPRGTGYVIDTIWSARKALREDTFEDVVRTAILFGEDTDTTSAVASGLAGIRFGVRGIPKRWLEQLRGFEVVKPTILHSLQKLITQI